jgi:hypothetical protein
MARLTTAQRKRIPKSEYGLPAKAKKGKRGGAPRGAFPMPDKEHAANAKARAVQGRKKGTLSSSKAAQIIRKANKILKAKGAKTISGKPVKKAPVKKTVQRRKRK